MHKCVCVRVIWIVYACGCVCAMYIFVACECAGDTYASNTYLALECFYFFVLLFSFDSNRGYENSFMYLIVRVNFRFQWHVKCGLNEHLTEFSVEFIYFMNQKLKSFYFK